MVVNELWGTCYLGMSQGLQFWRYSRPRHTQQQSSVDCEICAACWADRDRGVWWRADAIGCTPDLKFACELSLWKQIRCAVLATQASIQVPEYLQSI